ncbi:MAG: hypothetical protein KGQ67_01765 [Betaproteobacteria bacterium]|jgi:hypothetical protein|nr:hypothetical protein [Betaproteobacteria bacterium]
MNRLLIPDSGPLFSLAAGNLLPLLARFRVGITDVVRDETIGRGLLPGASQEARSLLAYYNANAANIETLPTQVGEAIAAKRAIDPDFPVPPNLGELSIQSLLIGLQLTQPAASPVVLFEDSWFLNNAVALKKPFILLSTQAFLEYAQEKRWIASAAQARKAIAKARPRAYEESVTLMGRALAP